MATWFDLIIPQHFLYGLSSTWLAPSMSLWVRGVSSQKQVRFISATRANIQDCDTEKMVEINVLCVHKKLCSKRVAAVLMHEIARQVHLEGTFPAFTRRGWHYQSVSAPAGTGIAPETHGSWWTARVNQGKLECGQWIQRMFQHAPSPHQVPRTGSSVTWLSAMSQAEGEPWFYPHENGLDTFVMENANSETSWALTRFSPPTRVWRLLIVSTMFTPRPSSRPREQHPCPRQNERVWRVQHTGSCGKQNLQEKLMFGIGVGGLQC